jgi:hypothetical protein
MRSAQFAIFGFGIIVCALNFFLSFVRPVWVRIVERKSEYRHVSGLPLIGSLATVAALIFFHLPYWAWIPGFALAVLDTGGIHWFIVTMVWKADSNATGSVHQ